MKIYKHHLFNKWLKKEKLTDNQLKIAVSEIEQGLIDADLGSGLNYSAFLNC
ncbi:MAG: type II toxin-antitoxin system RelE/ParE family toxin [Pseudomonadota bacterium]